MSLTLMSPAFAEGQPIPRKYTREGENLFPPLKWTGAPENARSFVLTVEDPDAPNGTFQHCAIFNIPADRSELPESVDTGPYPWAKYGRNDFGNAAYDGPEPPPGHGTHHYHFRLAALDVPNLTVPGQAGAQKVWDEAKKHLIDQAEIVGTYER